MRRGTTYFTRTYFKWKTAKELLNLVGTFNQEPFAGLPAETVFVEDVHVSPALWGWGARIRFLCGCSPYVKVVEGAPIRREHFCAAYSAKAFRELLPWFSRLLGLIIEAKEHFRRGWLAGDCTT